MGLYQVPAVVIALLTWLNAPSVTIGQAAQHEALRRALVQKAGHTLTDQIAPPPLPPMRSPTTPVWPAETIDVPPPPAPLPQARRVTDPGAAQTAAQTVDEAAAATPPAAAAQADHDQAWWQDRMAKARAALAHDQVLADAMQTQVNSLTNDWANRDDPAQKQKLDQQRQQALAELARLNKQIAADQQAIADIQQDARRQGVPPGWIR
jgi:hypothetical protein